MVTFNNRGSVEGHAKAIEGVDFVKRAFESFDVDKSGFIDPQELRAALVMLGVKVKLDEVGIEDRDGDGLLSLADLDTNGDQKIDFEVSHRPPPCASPCARLVFAPAHATIGCMPQEFKVLAAILPKRDHAIYRNALHKDPITCHPDPKRVTASQQDRIDAQEKTKAALNAVLRRIKEKMKLDDKKIMKGAR
jgi:hypothetical protein